MKDMKENKEKIEENFKNQKETEENPDIADQLDWGKTKIHNIHRYSKYMLSAKGFRKAQEMAHSRKEYFMEIMIIFFKPARGVVWLCQKLLNKGRKPRLRLTPRKVLEEAIKCELLEEGFNWFKQYQWCIILNEGTCSYLYYFQNKLEEMITNLELWIPRWHKKYQELYFKLTGKIISLD